MEDVVILKRKNDILSFFIPFFLIEDLFYTLEDVTALEDTNYQVTLWNHTLTFIT